MRSDQEAIPPDFEAALLSLRGHRQRAEIRLAEVPPPTRIAPYTAALTAEVNPTGEPEDLLGSGRFVVLHDPAEPTAWQGAFRIVVLARAHIEPELGVDPLLGQVAWSWLLDALETAGAGYHSISGSVTRVMSEVFGSKAGDGDDAEVEIRASWTPRTTDLGPHLMAWSQLCASTAGLTPIPPGVSVIGNTPS